MTDHSEVTLQAAALLRTHRIECTGIGEVTCKSCHKLGWMSWPRYFNHVAQALADAGMLADDTQRDLPRDTQRDQENARD